MTLRPRPLSRTRTGNRSGQIDDDAVGDGQSPAAALFGHDTSGGHSSGGGSRDRHPASGAAFFTPAAVEAQRLVKQQPRSLTADLAAFTRSKAQAAAGPRLSNPGGLTLGKAGPSFDVRLIARQSKLLDVRVMLASFVRDWLMQHAAARWPDRVVHVRTIPDPGSLPVSDPDSPIHR